MSQPSVDNQTEFALHPQLLLDREGEKLVAVAKATFEVNGDGDVELAPAARRRGIRFADVPWEKSKPESIAYPGDVYLRKPGTDVLFVAKARAPGGRPVPSFDVRVEVGALARSLVVFGRRLWLDGGSGLSAPAPLAEIEVRYDHAWGGRDEDARGFAEEPRNPIGMGFSRNPSALTLKPAPNLEDPEDLITSARTAPRPAGLGPIGRSWEPRRRYAGTYDRAWKELRAPLLPDDFDDRHNRSASPGLTAETPLEGGERVRTLNLTAGSGALAFELPRVALQMTFEVKGREPAVHEPHLDTVLVDLYSSTVERPAVVEMIWRASVRAPRRLAEARVILRERRPS